MKRGNIIENRIYNDDYLNVVKKLKKERIKVDAVITDPPYNVSRDYQLGFSNMGRAGMDYGDWDYNFDQKKWIRDVSPLIKKGGSIIIFNDWKNLGKISEQLDKLGFITKDILRWVKKNPMPRNVNRRYVTDCEYAIWAVKDGAKWTFNKPEEIAYLKPVIETGIVPGGKKRLHPTQKHLEVMEWVISIHTNPKDIVFDPFLGSGTTALACQKLDRYIIGAEIETKYYKTTLKRLKND